MMLAVDIGNTHTSFGLFHGRQLVRTFAVPTNAWRTGREPRLRGVGAADTAIICSVVPWATPKVAKAVRSLGVRRVRVVGRDVKVPLKNRYRYPRQVGQDRLVGAYAALKTYKRDCIVCDFGTAITIDIVKARHLPSSILHLPSSIAGEYLGGVIAPGLGISLDALANRTALLPRVELKKPPELLGRDTVNSIRSGVLYGTAALCDGLVLALKRRYAPNATVVATGGSAPLIARHARTIARLRPHLVLEGLRELFLKSK